MSLATRVIALLLGYSISIAIRLLALLALARLGGFPLLAAACTALCLVRVALIVYSGDRLRSKLGTAAVAPPENISVALAELCDTTGTPIPTVFAVPATATLSMGINAAAVASSRGAFIYYGKACEDVFTPPELIAVLAHELAHVRSFNGRGSLVRRIALDLPFRLLIQALIYVAVFGTLGSRTVAWSLSPLLALAVLVAIDVRVLVVSALHRHREAAADVLAADLTGDPEDLAAALAVLSQCQTPRLYGVPQLFLASHRNRQARAALDNNRRVALFRDLADGIAHLHVGMGTRLHWLYLDHPAVQRRCAFLLHDAARARLAVAATRRAADAGSA